MSEQENDELFLQVGRAFDFAFLAKHPRVVSEALARIDNSERIIPLLESLEKQKKAMAALHEIPRQMASPFQIMNAIQPPISQVLDGLSGCFSAYSNELQKMLERITFPSIDFAKINQDYLLDPLNVLAMEYGWPPLYHLSLGNPRYLFEEASTIENLEERQRFINEKITEFHRDTLDSILRDWEAQPFLEGTERLIIIKDAFEAHKQGKYSLSSPAILAQTEGIFIDHIEGGGKRSIGKGHYRKQVRRLAKSRGKKSIVYGTAEILCIWVENHALFGTNGPENPIAFEISRHSILHGISTTYCKREDISLRHLLWLDCLVRLVNDLKSEEDT